MHTPISVIIGRMTFLCACAVRGGLEGIARMSQIILPVMVLPVLTMIILLSPDMDPRNIFPVLENAYFPDRRRCTCGRGQIRLDLAVGRQGTTNQTETSDRLE